MKEGLRQQIVELTEVHKGLSSIVEHDNKSVVVSGSLPFEATADDLETITDTFDIELMIPDRFPEILPVAKEIGGRIEFDYDHLNSDRSLCLAIPVEQRRVFLESPTLLGFVNHLVIPYLYGYCYWKKHGHHPFGEAAHGQEGILRYYKEVLGLSDDVTTLAFITFLYEYGYRGHHDCPCGSGKKVRTCHGPVLLTLHKCHSRQTILTEFYAIFMMCLDKIKAGQLSLPEQLRRQLVRIIGRHKS